MSNSDHLRRSPTDKPPFTLTQLKKSIPPHCFQRSAPRSLSYVVSDLCIVAVLLYLALHQIPSLPPPHRLVAWPLYWFCQGCVLNGIMILGHECGHHAFSDYQTLDDTIGILLHSLLLIPYYSFKYSHRRHHSNTCSLDLDEVFVPKPKSSLSSFFKHLNNTPGRFIYLFVSLALGWHSYLSFNVSGRSYSRFASHYDPYSPIYSDRERAQIIVSDFCVLSVYYALYRLTVSFSLSCVIRIYGVPLLVMNGWVVLVTYLQHTHPGLPHYDSSEWDWIRGALATVDRDFGSVLNWVFHDATDAHVVHHLFSMIPHYHAREATEAIRPVLGEYYRFDGTPVWRAVSRSVCMWRRRGRNARECIGTRMSFEGSGLSTSLIIENAYNQLVV